MHVCWWWQKVYHFPPPQNILSSSELVICIFRWWLEHADGRQFVGAITAGIILLSREAMWQSSLTGNVWQCWTSKRFTGMAVQRRLSCKILAFRYVFPLLLSTPRICLLPDGPDEIACIIQAQFLKSDNLLSISNLSSFSNFVHFKQSPLPSGLTVMLCLLKSAVSISSRVLFKLKRQKWWCR